MENSLPKLSLEPRIGSAPFEVNEPDGSEKHMPKLTPSEKLEIQVRKIHEQRQFKSLTLDSLTNIENEEEKDIEENKVEKSFASKGVDLLKMHDTVTNNIITSHNEIAIGIDVMNLILAEQKMTFIPNNPFPVTPGLVHHTYPCYSPPSKDFQVQKYKLMLGMKRMQLKNSANILLSAASRLNDIVNNEKTFWNEMLSLRERHWSLRRGDKEKNIGQQIFVHYGYADVGSIHGDISKAQILRSPDEKQVAVSLPQKPKKAVKLRLQQRPNSLLTVEPCIQENSLLHSESAQGSNIHQQLITAQKAIFEGELFDQLVREARNIPGITLVENEIFVQIYEGVDLTIQWVRYKANIDSIKEAPSSDDTWTSKTANFDETITPDSSTPFTCTVLKLAMDLLLRRCHRIQLLKQQERVLNWTRGAPRESSGAQILNQVIHLLKYYFFCKHIRDIVNASTRALSSGGVPVQIHFISNLAKGKDLIEDIWKKIGNDKIFLFSGMMVVTIDHRHSLRFTLESPTSVIVHLPHGDIRTRGHAQFQDLFSRELILLLLRIIHEQLIYLTGLDNVVSGEGNWCVDIALLLIYKDIPPIISESSDKEVTQDKWSKSFWRRPIKISIVNGQPSPDKLTVKIDAFGISKGPELVIGGINNEGKHIRKEFGEIIYEFLISLM